MTIVIHGTHSNTNGIFGKRKPSLWWQPGSGFLSGINSVTGDVYPPVTDLGENIFSWSGINKHQARIEGGKALAHFIELRAGREPVRLVGHSHGGSVALQAVNELGGSVDVIVLIACPHFRSKESKFTNQITFHYWEKAHNLCKKIINLYSPQDPVQRWFANFVTGMDTPVKCSQEYKGPDASNVVNIPIRCSRIAIKAHTVLHSKKMGNAIGHLLKGSSWKDARLKAKLEEPIRNLSDRGH